MFITQGSVGGFCVVLARTNPDVAKQKRHHRVHRRARHEGLLGVEAPREARLPLERHGRSSRSRTSSSATSSASARSITASLDTMQILDRGRISIAAMALGLGYGALEMAIAYAKDRKQFDKPIAEFQAVQWMLADTKTELDAAQLLTYRAAWLADQGRPFTKEASMAKLFASEAATRACNKALQIHGGYGYTREFDVERHLRDAKICEIGEGTSEVQRMVIAKHLLRG